MHSFFVCLFIYFFSLLLHVASLFIWIIFNTASLFMYLVTGGRTLQILNAKEEDAGRYTCVATNEAGETLKNYEVKVFGACKN